MLTDLLANLGFTRDWRGWLWGRLLGASAAIVSGVFDLSYWATYIGVPLSTAWAHRIIVLAVVILWISGKQDHSGLPSNYYKP